MEHFVSIARDYCSWCESATTSELEEGKTLRSLLRRLYAVVLDGGSQAVAPREFHFSLRHHRIRHASAAIAALHTLILLSSCGTVSVPTEPIILTTETKTLTGWLSTKGLLELYGSSRIPSRYIYDRGEENKCVSLIYAGVNESRDLDGKHVIVEGFAVTDDELVIKGPRAPIPARLAYEGMLVENWCMRSYLFVVRNVEVRE